MGSYTIILEILTYLISQLPIGTEVCYFDFKPDYRVTHQIRSVSGLS